MAELSCFANPPALAKSIIDLYFLLLNPKRSAQSLKWSETSKSLKTGLNVLVGTVSKPDYKISEEDLDKIKKFMEKNEFHLAGAQIKAMKVSTASAKILKFSLVIFAILEKRK